jgi:hypothetical protein
MQHEMFNLKVPVRHLPTGKPVARKLFFIPTIWNQFEDWSMPRW